MDGDTPSWTSKYQNADQMSAYSQDLNKGAPMLGQNCTAVCDYDFFLESQGTGNQEKRECAVLCRAVAHTAATFSLIWECMAFFLNGNYEGNKRGI